MTMCYIPVFFIGTLLGCAVALIGITPTVIFCLSSVGAQSVTMDISVMDMVGIVAAIVLWSETIIVVCSAKIRKITPYEMQQ